MDTQRELEYLREEVELAERRTSKMIDLIRKKFPNEAANIEFDVQVWDVVEDLLWRLYRLENE